MLTHGVRVHCWLTNNAYWRSHSAKNEPNRWRWFFDENPDHFRVVAQPNSRTYDASGGQAASVLASISSCKICYNDVTEMPNAWERRVRDCFGSSSVDALAAAIFLTLRAILCLIGMGTFFTVPVDQNFSTRHSIVDLAGQLWRP